MRGPLDPPPKGSRPRSFRGLFVHVEYEVRTAMGEGMRITMPDGSQVECVPTPDYPSLDAAACRVVQDWRVDRWFESGHGGVI